MSKRNLQRVLNENIVIEGCRFTRTALLINRVDEETLRAAGAFLQTVEGSRAWWWGDFAHAYCEFALAADGVVEHDPRAREKKLVHYAARYAEAAKVEVSTIWDWRSMSAFYEPSRRREGLSWAHHRDAKDACGGDKAIADNWLDQAEKNDWSVSALRAAIRAKRKEGQDDDEPMVTVRVADLIAAKRWANTTLKRVPDIDEQEAHALLADLEPLVRLAATLRTRFARPANAA